MAENQENYDVQTRAEQKRSLKEAQLARFKRLLVRVEKQMSKPSVTHIIEKLAFTLGVMYLAATCILLGNSPSLMPYWYMIFICPLLTLRYLIYYRNKWHYFMLDFCYFVQGVLLFNIIFYPNSPHLFQLVFTFSHGPLLWALIVWRNSLVFHDLDKITSVFIHTMPGVVAFSMRWWPQSNIVVCANADCSMSLREVLLGPTLVYLIWQLMYYLKTAVIDKQKLAKDEQIVTSIRWVSTKPGTLMYNVLRRVSAPWQNFVFMCLQLLYTILTVLPVPLMYNYFTANVVFFCFTLSVCVWNGAHYYFEVFAKVVMKKLEEEQAKGDDQTPEKRQAKGEKAASVE
eukprot:TRINITY_DN1207_c0_g1_i2.p1 TRINITY_DN1207_c0_g1~~TRINITY_DN1207_c0_g1_i2.p1  ORF type:complete len:354 (+),score=70.39 TRINITY_DN1207_c0_g1_i2:34-1062(+)